VQCRPVVERKKSGVFSFSDELGRWRRLLLVSPSFLALPSFSSFLPFLLRCRAATVPPVRRPGGWKARVAERLCFYSELGYGGRTVDAAAETRGGNQGCYGRVLGRGVITMASWRARFHTTAGLAPYGGVRGGCGRGPWRHRAVRDGQSGRTIDRESALA
jgi:hypothetical protein